MRDEDVQNRESLKIQVSEVRKGWVLVVIPGLFIHRLNRMDDYYLYGADVIRSKRSKGSKVPKGGLALFVFFAQPHTTTGFVAFDPPGWRRHMPSDPSVPPNIFLFSLTLPPVFASQKGLPSIFDIFVGEEARPSCPYRAFR